MTTTIHLEFEGKTARLPLQSPKRTKVPPAVQRRTNAGAVTNVRIFNAARRVDPKTLTPETVASGDPELDLSMAGTLADPDLLSTAFVDKDGAVVRDFEEIEVVLAPDGTEKERRPRTDRAANVNDVRPIKVGKFMPLDEALTSFVFRGVYQVVQPAKREISRWSCGTEVARTGHFFSESLARMAPTDSWFCSPTRNSNYRPDLHDHR
jgi:hypothetical protein